MTEDQATPVALVTGASRGLGAAMALELAATHHVVAVARTTGALEELDDRIQESGGQATLAPMDITNEGAMAQLCRSIYDRWGRIDIWVHTAVNAAPLAPAGHMDAKDWQKSVEVNVNSVARLIPFLTPLMNADARAVFFDDTRAGEKFFGVYGATKAAQIALARSWQAENVKIGPHVHILTPNPMNTATRARFFPGEDRTVLAHARDEARRLISQI